MNTVYGYARCSTDITRQDIDGQKRKLRRLGMADDSHIYWESILRRQTLTPPLTAVRI